MATSSTETEKQDSRKDQMKSAINMKGTVIIVVISSFSFLGRSDTILYKQDEEEEDGGLHASRLCVACAWVGSVDACKCTCVRYRLSLWG